MYKISEFAAMVGLSRTAILYYEKQKLISGTRLENGYRIYKENDLQRVRLIQQLLAGGLTLKECKLCLEAKVERQVLQSRLKILDEEIEQKQQARNLLSAMLGEGDLKAWHTSLDKLAPDAHLDWLTKQGFSEKEALRLKWLSKDMNEHDTYMADFMKIFETLERWAPGSEADTLKALSLLPKAPSNILEIGCGKGLATQVLAQSTEAKITALDNEQSALDRLIKRFEQQGLSERLDTLCVSMADLPFADQAFDLIWAEGSAYIIGIEKALAHWKSQLDNQGFLVFSDLVWHTEHPSQDPIAFWEQEYPDMQQVKTRITQIEKAGYRVVNHFPQSKAAWLNYYTPLSERATALTPEMRHSAALKNVKHEVSVCTQFANEFGYHMFILAKK